MSTLHSASPRGAWALALALTAVAGTLATACMMPFVALAVAAAATMPRSRAAATVALAWGANQLIGFTLLGYPLDAHAIEWGIAIGLASLAAMQVAAWVLAGRRDLPALVPAFLAAFTAFEGSLFAFALVAGGTATFAPSIVLRILANDAAWFAGLVALHVALTRTAPRLFGATLAYRTA